MYLIPNKKLNNYRNLIVSDNDEAHKITNIKINFLI